MDTRIVTCIICPNGCAIEVNIAEGEIISVSGNLCQRGALYAQEEITHPTRMLTTTIEVKNGLTSRVPVKSKRELPKEILLKCMESLKDVKAEAPVRQGDVVAADILGTGIDMIATGNVNKR